MTRNAILTEQCGRISGLAILGLTRHGSHQGQQARTGHRIDSDQCSGHTHRRFVKKRDREEFPAPHKLIGEIVCSHLDQGKDPDVPFTYATDNTWNILIGIGRLM